MEQGGGKRYNSSFKKIEDHVRVLASADKIRAWLHASTKVLCSARDFPIFAAVTVSKT